MMNFETALMAAGLVPGLEMVYRTTTLPWRKGQQGNAVLQPFQLSCCFSALVT